MSVRVFCACFVLHNSFQGSERMKSTISMRGVLSALLTAMALMLALIVPAGTAVADTDPQFDMSLSSVRAGQTTVVTELDPCPTPDPNSMSAWVEVQFTDSGATTSLFNGWVDAQGSWSVWLTPSARRILSFGPTTYEPGAALGQATVQVKCVDDGVTTMSYVSQSLTISDTSAEFSVSPSVVEAGEVIHLESVDPCPSGSDSVHAIADDMNTNNFEGDTALGVDGSWEMDVSVPSWYPDGPILFWVRCMPPSSSAGDRTQVYGEESATISLDERYYVAAGDSYSSGVGTFNYDSASGNCLRSEDSYAPYVGDQLAIGEPFFVACSGAQTADFYGQNPNSGEARQLNALTDKTRYVTLTIGGNDAGFAGVMDRCVHRPGHTGWGCASDTSVANGLTQRINTLAGVSSASAPDNRQITDLQQVYEDIAADAPHAKIYVGGYPRLFGNDQADYVTNASAPGGAQCIVTTGGTVSYDDAQWLNQKANDLNGVIQDAVDAAQNAGVDITYVPAALFSSHALCDSSDPWINEVIMNGTNPQPESMHPTSEGYQNGYGIAFVTIMN